MIAFYLNGNTADIVETTGTDKDITRLTGGSITGSDSYNIGGEVYRVFYDRTFANYGARPSLLDQDGETVFYGPLVILNRSYQGNLYGLDLKDLDRIRKTLVTLCSVKPGDTYQVIKS